VFREPFAREQLIAFCFIWLGLAAFSVDLVRQPLSRTGR
jgi:EamA domain-containing membrane protein RarD